MDNATIIFQESLRLMEEGVLRGSGQKAVVQTEDGEREIELPEVIHTYQGWKQIGYSVSRGQHAKAKIQIWIPKKHKKKDENQEDNQPIKQEFILRTAAFFTEDQVEKISEKFRQNSLKA